MPVYDLPTQNDASAPRFDKDNPLGLAGYFKELEYLFEKHRVSDATQRKQSAVRYVSLDVQELWQCAAAWGDPTRSYEAFKAEVHAFYPEATDAFRYTTWDLSALVNERAQREMESIEDLGTFYRKFIVVSTFLIKRDRLSTLEQARWFLSSFSGNQITHLQQRLELKNLKAHFDDIPDLGDILEEAQFVLLRKRYSSRVVGVTTPSPPQAPWRPEKQNATKARAPASVQSAPTPSTSFSVILAPAAAPLTPESAMGPCDKRSTISTTILSAASTSPAANGPLSDHPPVMEQTISQSGMSCDRRGGKRSADNSILVNIVSPAVPISTMETEDPPTHLSMEPVIPLPISPNRWVATSTGHNPSLDAESPEMVERKLKTLLNKLTTERFDSISDKIIAWANKSEKENDGRTLTQVITVIFESATNDAMFSGLYARLCRTMLEKVSPMVQDHHTLTAKRKPCTGGQLFRKYLVNRCQEDFERAWFNTGTTDVQAVKEATEKNEVDEVSELRPDDHHAAAKAKRRALGLIVFMGELFKLQILTERIAHECIKMLLRNVENPEEDEVESLAVFLTATGSLLDTPKAHAQFDVYFSRIRKLLQSKNVNGRLAFKLVDVIELRKRQWVLRNTIATPTAISGTQPKAGGPLQSGMIDAIAVSSSKKGDPEDSGPSMSQALAPQRQKLKLLPRTKSIGETSQVIKPAASQIGYDEEVAGAGMTEADAKAKIDQDVRAFFSIRVLDEAETYFSSLPTEHRHLLVEILVAKSVEMKEPDVRLVGDLFVRVREKGLCNSRIFEEGFSRLAEILNDLAHDIPAAWSYFAMLLRGSGLDQDEERRARIGDKTMNHDKLNRLLLDAGLLAPHI